MMANLGATCTCACTGPSGISLHFLHCAEGEKMPHHGKLALAAALHSRPERRHLSSKRLNRPLPILHIAPCIILPSLLLLLLLLELLLLGRSHAKRAHSDTAIAARWLHPCELGEANSVARLGGCLDLVQAAVKAASSAARLAIADVTLRCTSASARGTIFCCSFSACKK